MDIHQIPKPKIPRKGGSMWKHWLTPTSFYLPVAVNFLSNFLWSFWIAIYSLVIHIGSTARNAFSCAWVGMEKVCCLLLNCILLGKTDGRKKCETLVGCIIATWLERGSPRRLILSALRESLLCPSGPEVGRTVAFGNLLGSIILVMITLSISSKIIIVDFNL